MVRSLAKYLFLSALLLGAAEIISAQSDSGILPASGRAESKEDQPRNFREMLSKQRVERERKDHEELLKRGDEAARLTEQLENAFEQTNTLTSKDKQNLETLEKIVVKIRKELGGDDDDGEEAIEVKGRRPSTLGEAFDSLKETTMKLVDELKKSSRFTVSAIAIQSSNNVLKLVRFLRLRK
mgnify:CR=1 FL=1